MVFKTIINRPFIWEHIQSNCEVSFSILIKNQLPGVRFNSNSSSITRVFVETAEGYLDLTNSRYNGVICNWDLQDCVAINHKTSSVSGGCTTAGQCSFKGEVCPCFRGNTLHVSQGDMFTIQAEKKSFRQGDGHVILVTLHWYTRCYRIKYCQWIIIKVLTKI